MTDRRQLNEPLIQEDAVIRNLEIIGEAVKALSEDTRASESRIPWSSIAAMRDRLVHHYFSVDLDLVWDVITTHLGPLETAVDDLLRRQADQSPQ